MRIWLGRADRISNRSRRCQGDKDEERERERVKFETHWKSAAARLASNVVRYLSIVSVLLSTFLVRLVWLAEVISLYRIRNKLHSSPHRSLFVRVRVDVDTLYVYVPNPAS